jgi:hypothetical protein
MLVLYITSLSSRRNDQSFSSLDQDHKKYKNKSQIELDTVENYKAQSPKPAYMPIAFVSHQMRNIKPTFPKPPGRQDKNLRL